tara:strand:+ start:427 stop:639 length:213 start_codon:yes stop_codon:yes gene_type:complete
MKIKANNYDGYVEIINRIKDIVNGEPLDDIQKDNLITKIDSFQNEICEFVVQKKEWNNTLMRVYQSRKYE